MAMEQQSSSPPSPPNPFRTVFDSFKSTTPFATRSFLTTVLISYAVSWILPLGNLFNNSPPEVLRGQLHRLILSPFAKNALFHVIFAFMTFARSRIEYRLGSTELILLLLSIDVLSNLTFTFIYLLLSNIMSFEKNESDVSGYPSASGVWIVLFGMLAVESYLLADYQQSKPFMWFQVPTLYYPLILYAFFTFVSLRIDLGNLCSLVVGYTLAYTGKIPLGGAVVVSRLENSYFEKLKDAPGWVVSTAVLGDGAWGEQGEPELVSSLYT